MTVSPMRALVVEDDHSWQQILSEILSDCGLEVDVAASVNTASFDSQGSPTSSGRGRSFPLPQRP